MSAGSKNNRTLLTLVGVVLVMGGLAWASVPLYSLFCRVTGFGGATVTASSNEHDVLDRTIKIRFDGSTDRGLPWKFTPKEREVEMRIGETGLAFYEATNLTDRPIAGTAAFNVTPEITGGYFVKIDCFCFTLQVLKPGETVQMPVTFYVDPDIVNDPDASKVPVITLSYTFYETDLPEDYAALADRPETKQN